MRSLFKHRSIESKKHALYDFAHISFNTLEEMSETEINEEYELNFRYEVIEVVPMFLKLVVFPIVGSTTFLTLFAILLTNI
jgi:hypothetical protein